MEINEAKTRYRDLGLEVRYIDDKPGKVYEPHRHEGVFLYTVEGSAEIKLDEEDWKTTLPGEEVPILDGQLHEAVAGPKG